MKPKKSNTVKSGILWTDDTSWLPANCSILKTCCDVPHATSMQAVPPTREVEYLQNSCHWKQTMSWRDAVMHASPFNHRRIIAYTSYTLNKCHKKWLCLRMQNIHGSLRSHLTNIVFNCQPNIETPNVSQATVWFTSVPLPNMAYVKVILQSIWR